MAKKPKTVKLQLSRSGPAYLGYSPWRFRRDMQRVPIPVDVPKKDAAMLLARYPDKLEVYRVETKKERHDRIEREVTADQIASAVREGYLEDGLDGIMSALRAVVEELGIDPPDDADDEPPAVPEPKAAEGPVDPPTGEGTPVPGDAPDAEPSLADLDAKKGGGKKKR